MFTQPDFSTPASTSQQFNAHDSAATAAAYEDAVLPQASEMAWRPTEPSRSVHHDYSVSAAENHVTSGASASFAAPHNQNSRQFKPTNNARPERPPSVEPPVSPRQDAPAQTNRILTHDQRTLELSSLSPDTMMKDVTEHIRGGMVIEIHTFNNRSVRVSFLRGSDAQAFRTYARRNDIYINSKRVCGSSVKVSEDN